MLFSDFLKRICKGRLILITIVASIVCTLLLSKNIGSGYEYYMQRGQKLINAKAYTEVTEQLSKEVDEQVRKEVDEQARKEVDEQARKEADEQAYNEDQEEFHPRIALLFMLQSSCFYMERLWAKYLQDEPANDYMIVVHQQGIRLEEPERNYMDMAFMSLDVRSQIQGPIHYVPTVIDAHRFTSSLSCTGLLLAKHAYIVDPSATCFILLSETTIPLIPLSELRQMLLRRDGNGNWSCRSNLRPKIIIPDGIPVKIGQWFVASRWHIKFLIEHNSAEAEAVEKLRKWKNDIGRGIFLLPPGKWGALDEMVFSTALSSVLSRLAAEGSYANYKELLTREVQDAEDAKDLELFTISFFTMEHLWYAASILEPFIMGSNPRGAHPLLFDASFLAKIPIAKLREDIPGTAFFRKVAMPKISLWNDSGKLRSCTDIMETFETTININNVYWS